ncbi:alpha/beta fold hydrolase [Microtetraspora malaysiensis]|uniref:alpha/beta fold hydrolase n=1 Tax=Microtetraspora malaysiensis TaxID=161358 RepID=UPI001471719D|nr:alpha/beta fold hydrolase [Microtetraspora malaysiensis]
MMRTKERRQRGRTAWLAVGVTAAALAGMTPAASATRDGQQTWRDCAGQDTPAGMRCAAIEVPVDWAKPDGPTIKLDLARLPATESTHRIGSVLGIPGGPGADGIEDLKRAAADLTELGRRFDIVAYKPRTRVWLDQVPPSCMQPATSLSDPRNRKEYTTQATAMAKAFEACQKTDKTGLFAHMDSLSAARDMEAVREALGEERLSFMANSYGGVPAAAYARLFPQRIRAMYLDGVINQVDGWPNQGLRILRVAERVFTRFTAWCAATPACALHGQDAGAVWRKLIRDADRKPIPVTTSEFGKGTLTGWHLRSFGFPTDPGPGNANWLAFAAAVHNARGGDGSGFAEFALGNARVWAMPAMPAMSCGDDRGYTSYAQLQKFRRQARKISPNFGGGATMDALACAGWPLKVANPSRPLPSRGLPPVLGVGSTWGDYAWTESFTKMIPNSVTVGYDGPGHVMYLSGRKCPIRHATTYLAELKLPTPGTTCPAE